MPVKRGDSGNRWVEMAFIVPGTAEEVWRALATGSGNTAWFAATEIEERIGGAIRFDFGPQGSSMGEVTAWEPPGRFGYVEREWMEGAPPVATEVTIERRTDGQCVVRMVHSLQADRDDWDEQLEGFEGGWPGFFEVLRVYLRYFSGQSAATFRAVAPCPNGGSEAWTKLMGALGLTGVNTGERREAPADAPAFAGVTEFVQLGESTRYIIVRLDTPRDAIAFIGSYVHGQETFAAICVYLYGADAAEAVSSVREEWETWLGALYARSGAE